MTTKCEACEWDASRVPFEEGAQRLDHTCGKEWPKYLNVYELQQCYGGPEEGGRWFDAGTPYESIRVLNQSHLDSIVRELRERYELDEKGGYKPADPEDIDIERQRGRTSCAGGYDIAIYVEEGFAESFPKTRPRYE